MRIVIASLALCALAACSTSPDQRRSLKYHLSQGPNIGKVVATELAFARAAQEDGQWTAFEEYAADGALLFGRNGAVEAKPWLESQENPPEAVQWEPHRVWSSCDGSIAVTQGGFVDPEGIVGTFNTVWRRQDDGEYLYVFDFGIPQGKAPMKPEMIASKVAKCGERLAAPAPEDGAALRYSADGSLAWSFHLVGEGERRYNVWVAGEAGWEEVVDIDLAPEPKQ